MKSRVELIEQTMRLFEDVIKNTTKNKNEILNHLTEIINLLKE